MLKELEKQFPDTMTQRRGKKLLEEGLQKPLAMREEEVKEKPAQPVKEKTQAHHLPKEAWEARKGAKGVSPMKGEEAEEVTHLKEKEEPLRPLEGIEEETTEFLNHPEKKPKKSEKS